ncbi:efflux RND transporter permease subunit [Ensifer sesbaniae]|uniref:efflux RND transporter permease subunit n=1 Tax=Ensifer sesbaniae TaxID=1214071 RepID=UPI001568E115|nr:efflux RND transporter permease subunit [Ensifer sesbaniae]MCK3779250.1 efflux RND transporter permease subunit [Ensifer sesbaniae]NRQ18481.1 Multidrug resistance protein MdtC [Ensifer sesbaniae]
MTSNISAWAIRKPVPTIVLFVVFTLMGIASFLRLPVNANPSVSFPVVTVVITQPSAQPAEMETQVTRRVEGVAAGLVGVSHMRSTITNGVSTTTVEFKIGTDPDRAANDVREAVAQIRSDLPQSIQEPIVSRVDVDGSAIVYYAVRAPDMSPVELSWFVDDTINSELLTLPGVQKVQRLGGVNREVRVSLNPERLLAAGVTADQVNTALREINTNIPSGRGEIGGREQSIRTVGSAASVEELSRLSIPLSGGRWVQLSDIATIEDTSSEPRNFARVDGEPVVSFSVSRSKGASDTVVADAVAARLKEIRQRMPGVEFTELISLVEYTQESYDAAVTALIEGAILTVVVVFAFLRNWRATLISALAMPLSILPTFAVMDLLGFTLNGISLLALTLVIGILVDDAIVEIENIERHVDMGKRPFIAAIDAADAIGLAIVATTLTIVAVFAPVSFIGGAVGQYFKQFGLTVAIAVLFSLAVARLLTPLMAAYLLRPRGGHGHSGKPSRIADGYRRLLGWTLDHRKTALSLVALIFIGSIGLLTMLPTGFLPTSDSNVSQLKITLPPGTRLEETARISDHLVAQIKAKPEVDSVLATAENLNEVSLRIKLKPREERGLDRKSFELSLRPLLAATPDIQATFSSVEGVKDLSIYLTSDDPEALMASVRRLEKEMRALPGLVNVQSTEPLLSPELLVKPRFDEAARLGVSVTSIGTVARIATMGDSESNSARFNLGNRQVPIRVMLDQSARGDVDTLRNLRVGTNAGTVVPLTSVADISFGAEESSVERLDRKRLIAVEANLNGITLGTAFQAISALPAMTELPLGVSQANYGEAEYMSEMFRNFALALLAGILMVAAVLVLLFKDFLQPITILVALPLSIGGAALALLLFGASLDLSSTIGILMLMGIVCKNSILLVDHAIECRNGGADRRTALLTAGVTRARPIIMTTIAMVAGMVPAAIGIGADAAFRAPMAIAVIGGLITSTMLSLVFVPVMFTVMDDINAKLGRRLKRFSSVTDEDRATDAARIGHGARGAAG